MYTIDKILENPDMRDDEYSMNKIIIYHDMDLLNSLKQNMNQPLNRDFEKLVKTLEVIHEEDMDDIYSSDKSSKKRSKKGGSRFHGISGFRTQSNIFTQTLENFLKNNKMDTRSALKLVSDKTRALLKPIYPHVIHKTVASLDKAIEGKFKDQSDENKMKLKTRIHDRIVHFAQLFQIAKKIKEHLNWMRATDNLKVYEECWKKTRSNKDKTHSVVTYIRIEMLTIYCLVWAMYKRITEKNNFRQGKAFTRGILYELRQLLDEILEEHKVSDFMKAMHEYAPKSEKTKPAKS